MINLDTMTEEEIAAAAAEAGMEVDAYVAGVRDEQARLADAAAAADAAALAAAEAGGTSEGRPLPPAKIAFVIDGKLVDVLHTDERLAAIFLSNPTIVDVTETYNVEFPFSINSTYDPETNTFTAPAPTL